jgi:hypothetical protein
MILLLFLGQESLDSESLVRRLGEKQAKGTHYDGEQKQKSSF